VNVCEKPLNQSERGEDFKKKMNISDMDMKNLIEYFELRFGCKCVYVPKADREKYDFYTLPILRKIEHKLDFQRYDSGNIIIEYKNVRGRLQWYFRCEADYLLQSSYPDKDEEKGGYKEHGWMRMYHWPTLHDYIETNKSYFERYLGPGGDNNMMINYKIPLTEIEHLVIWKDDWDPPFYEGKETIPERRERIIKERDLERVSRRKVPSP